MLSYLKLVISVAKQKEIPLGTMLLICIHKVRSLNTFPPDWFQAFVVFFFLAHGLSTLRRSKNLQSLWKRTRSQPLLKRTKLAL